MDYPYVLGNGGGLPGGLFGKMARNQRYILNNADVAEGFAPKLLQPRNSSGKTRLHQEDRRGATWLRSTVTGWMG